MRVWEHVVLLDEFEPIVRIANDDRHRVGGPTTAFIVRLKACDDDGLSSSGALVVNEGVEELYVLKSIVFG